jgi:hypothetical protein
MTGNQVKEQTPECAGARIPSGVPGISVGRARPFRKIPIFATSPLHHNFLLLSGNTDPSNHALPQADVPAFGLIFTILC